MRRVSVVLAALAAVALFAAPGAAAVSHRSLVERLQAAVDGQVTDGIPGIVIHVVDPAHGLNWHGVSGHVTREGARPLRPGASFRISSVTKTFTAAVMLRLVEEGRI